MTVKLIFPHFPFFTLLQQIANREREGAIPASGGGGKRRPEDYPDFGTSASAWSHISAFYAYWSDFVSRLSFGWADEYREQDAPNRYVSFFYYNRTSYGVVASTDPSFPFPYRQVRRAMEKENRKTRDAARKKYQDGIRGLVEYIRKRDKRVIQHQVDLQKQEAEKSRLDAEEAKKRAEEYKVQRDAWLAQQTEHWESEEQQRKEEEEAGGQVAFRLADEESDGDDEPRGGRKGRKGGGGGGGGGGKGRKGGRRRGGGVDDEGSGGAVGIVYECAVCAKTFKVKFLLCIQ